jgi:GTP-binding protein
MRILSVEFDGAIGAPGGPQPPDPLPQVAFAGRSNVGKSSLINRLLGRTRTQMARVSGRPGKTREINFYRVRARPDDEGAEDLVFHLVDLPGYGFARVPEAVREAWGETIDRYLADSDRIRGVVQLVDARHAPKPDDRRMVEFLASTGVPVLVVATKVDKLRPAARPASVAEAVRALGVDEEQVLAFSAHTGEGREELLAALEDLIGPDGTSAEEKAPRPNAPVTGGTT